MQPTDHYVIISADSHAGGSHEQYREYLDPQYQQAFDDWRGAYKNPFQDLKDTDLRVRNWDSDVRDGQQNADGIVGEVIFPNTVPPFFPNFVLFAQPPTPDEYELRHAGVQAHNRWLADYVAEKPEARAGIGQIFTNDVDDAVADAIWCKEHGLRGGVLVSAVPPTCDWIKPLHHPDYDPLWKVCEELQIPVNSHSGTGGPVYPRSPATPLVHVAEMIFYSQRPLVHMILGGVFERFPNLQFVITEAGCHWVPGLMEQLDSMLKIIRSNEVGEMRLPTETVPPRSATEYFQQSCHVGVSQPRPDDLRVGALRRRPRPPHVGQRLPARGGHAPVHHGAPPPGHAGDDARADPGLPRRQRRGALRVRPRGAAPRGGEVRADGGRGRGAAHRAAGRRQPGAQARGGAAHRPTPEVDLADARRAGRADSRQLEGTR